MTTVAYVVTVGLATLGIVSSLAPLLAGVLARVAGGFGLLSGLLAGSLLGWATLNWVWRIVEGGSIPLAALGLSFVAIGFHERTAGEDLTPMAKQTVGAEMWAIVILAIALAITASPVRWY